MRYLQDLQVALRERLRRLTVADETTAGTELSLVVDWINKQPALRALLVEADRAEPDLDFEGFRQALQDADGEFTWPHRTEEGRASLVWKLMQHLAEVQVEPGRDIVNEYAFPAVGMSASLTDNWREFTRRILEPLFDYLTERVGAESSVLYVLERYVRRVEWFDRQSLHDQAEAEPRRTEEIYDSDLRRFLFSEGINMPFSQAKSASGLSDVISELDTDDPLVCELKVFDGASRGKAHLGSGVNQAVQYATDYGKHTAYLVIINRTERPLTLPSDGEPGIWPPYLDVAGVRVYLIAVRALPTVSASKQGRPAPVNITRSDLVRPDPADSGAD